MDLSKDMGADLDSAVPVVQQVAAVQLFESPEGLEEDVHVLVVEINFNLEAREIHGYLGLILDLGATERLIEFVDRYIESMGLSG